MCLLLDKEVQHLPWESVPILRSQPVTRMPSFHFLAASLAAANQTQDNNNTSREKTVWERGVDPKKTYYFLNPMANPADTQQELQEWFSD